MKTYPNPSYSIKAVMGEFSTFQASWTIPRQAKDHMYLKLLSLNFLFFRYAPSSYGFWFCLYLKPEKQLILI